MNQRNIDYVLPYNKLQDRLIADNKVVTKDYAIQNGIPVPLLYGTIESYAHMHEFSSIIEPYPDFVIKPSRGSGGKGVLIIKEKIRNKFRKTNGEILTHESIQQHIQKIISGIFSLGGQNDTVMIEYRIKMSDLFNEISYYGVPDIRLIVFQGYPVMAMLRLPTIKSGGRANLHQGAIGVGIRIASGITTQGIMSNEVIDEHPDTLNSIKDIALPNWDTILRYASQCYDVYHLGYIGVDIVYDKDLGPMILEINGRPGLNIQIANNDGLARRCRLIQQHVLRSGIETLEQRIAYSTSLFD